jgi:hypothetical protein
MPDVDDLVNAAPIREMLQLLDQATWAPSRRWVSSAIGKHW